MKRAVLLTVPHGFCPEGALISQEQRLERHVCDNAALRAANALFDQIAKTLPDAELALKFSGTVRAACDMNRLISRLSCFRQDVLQWIGSQALKYGAQNVYVLDIHSFPAGVNAYQEQQQGGGKKKQQQQQDYDLVILDQNASQTSYDPFNLSLYNTLKWQTHLSVQLEKGANNDITEQSRYFVLGGASLIEFNEQLPPEALGPIANILAIWLAGYIRLQEEVRSLSGQFQSSTECPCRVCTRERGQANASCATTPQQTK